MKKNLRILLAVLLSALALAGCETSTDLKINTDDTYDIKLHFSQPRTVPNGKCAEQIPGLEEYRSLESLKINDKSDKKTFDCEVTLSKQHISKAKSPFVTIKHRGESYQVKLEPLKGLDFLETENSNFRLTIAFPGPITAADSKVDSHIKGNTITWRNATVLVEGFEVTGQDHPGMTFKQRLLLGLGCLLLAAIIALYLLRKRTPVATFLSALGKLTSPVTRRLRAVLIRGLEYLDLAHSTTPKRRSRRARSSSRTAPAGTKTDLPPASPFRGTENSSPPPSSNLPTGSAQWELENQKDS